jgi:hypothetical protein
MSHDRRLGSGQVPVPGLSSSKLNIIVQTWALLGIYVQKDDVIKRYRVDSRKRKGESMIYFGLWEQVGGDSIVIRAA